MKDFPLIRSGKAALWGMVLLAGVPLALALTPITGLYALLMVALLMPAGMCLVAAVGGIAPALVGLIAGAVAAFRLTGVPGLIVSFGYLAAVFAAFMWFIWKKPAFFKGCGVMIAVHMVALGCALVYVQSLFDNQLYLQAADSVVQYVSALPECDSLLVQLYSMGFLALPQELENQLIVLTNGMFVMSSAVRQDMLLSLGSLAESMLSSLMPVLLVQHSIISGVACLLLSLRFGKLHHDKMVFRAKEGERMPPFPETDMPPLSLWHLPRGMGWKVGAAWLIGSLIQNTGGAVGTAGAVLYLAADAVFTWQGAALLNFTQKAKGTRRPMRVVLPCLFFALGILGYLGIFDQIVNLRGLRKPPEPKEEL